jgi:hypothetical protein
VARGEIFAVSLVHSLNCCVSTDVLLLNMFNLLAPEFGI